MKLKTLRALRKRVKITGRGRLIRFRAGKSHLLSGKEKDRKRRLSRPAVLKRSEHKRLIRFLPYI